MNDGTRADVSEDRDLNRIMSWFITTCWVACVCIAVTVEIARRAFVYDLSYTALYVTTAALFLVAETKAVLLKADRRTENLLTIIDEMIDYAYMKSDGRGYYRSVVLQLEPIGNRDLVNRRDGTGLGLLIVKRAVEALGRRITIYSELDKRTTFRIYLPSSADQLQGEKDETDPDH